MSELIKADNEYKEWIAGISTDFRKSQIRASVKINDEMLRFYWKLGKGISSMSEQFGYGLGFYKTVSDDLKSILPDVKSFSPTNLKYMRYFYEMYPDAVICPQVEDELITDANRPQVGDDLQIIFRIPEDAVPGTLTIFSHRMTIVRVLGSKFLLYHFGIKAVIISKYHVDTN